MEKFYFVLVIVVAYFLGNISPSTILAKSMGIDIKKEGSGNAGTTNTLRVLGPKAALITLIVDIGKGTLAVGLALLLSTHTAAMYCVVAAFIGHVWPVCLKFKGGKGVAVAFGALLAFNWQLALIALGIVIASVLITRKVSFGSLIAAATFPFACWYFEPDFIYLGTLLAVLVIFNHRTNIVRLIHGEEENISFSKYKKGGK
jgi:glycerol-3-phosphate acyltransferase PlsY